MAYGTKGQVVRLYAESALGTQGSEIGEIRYNECSIKFEDKQASEQSNLGHMHWGNVTDRPIRYNGVMPDAVSLSLAMRSGLAATNKPVIMTILEASGCAALTSTADTVATPGTGTFIATGGAQTVGTVVGMELPTKGFYPSLIANNTAKTITPMMDLPEQSGAAGKICKMFTVYPSNSAAGATDTLQIAKYTRGIHTTAPDLCITAAGCGLSKVESIVIEPSKPVELKATLHATSVAMSAVTLPVETFVDSQKYQVVGSGFEFGFAPSVVAGVGGITYATAPILKAEINLGLSGVPIPGEGATSCVNGVQGYWTNITAPSVTITRVYANTAQLQVWNATNADLPWYMHFVQPSANTSNPMWGLFCPQCYLSGPPQVDFTGADYIVQTETYTMSTGRLNAVADTEDGVASAPWFFAIGLPA